MWLKNALIYVLEEPFAYNAEQFAERLQQRVARPCPKTQPYVYGWRSPYGDAFDQLVHESNQCLLFANCKEERVLPSAVVKQALEEKIQMLETQEQREVYGKERSRLKDDIIFSLLPQAFTKKTDTFAYIDNEKNWLIIEAGSRSKAETFIELLRNTLGQLKMLPLYKDAQISKIMAQWLLQNQAPEGFEFGGDCEMRDKEKDHGAIKFTQLKITDSEVTNHLKFNRRLAKLELIWQQRISFILNDDFSLSRIRFLDVIKESLEDLEQPDNMQKFEAEFAIMSLEMRHCLTALTKAFKSLSKSKTSDSLTELSLT